MLAVDPLDDAPPARQPEAVDCVVGDTICQVRILSEAEWQAIPPDRRPSPAEFFPGLGWVAADVRRAR